MTKMLIAVLSLSVLGYLAYRTMYGRAAAVDEQKSEQPLQNVREKARDIEQKDEQRLGDVERKTQE